MELSERAVSACAVTRAYAIRPSVPISSCSPLGTLFGLVRDIPVNEPEASIGWETFSAADVARYFTAGFEKLQENVAALADLSVAYSEAQEKELNFMIESLIATRRFLDS